MERKRKRWWHFERDAEQGADGPAGVAWSQDRPQQFRMHDGDIRLYRQVITNYAATYDMTYSATGLHRVAEAHAIRIRWLLGASLTPRQRAQALALFAETTAMCGWLALGSDDRPLAVMHWDTAMSAAAECDDPAVRAGVLLSRSEAHVPTHPCDEASDPAAALALAEQASAVVGGWVDARLRSWFAARFALIAAAMGAGGVYADLIEEAWQLNYEATDPSQLGFFSAPGRFTTWDASWVRYHEAGGMARLGRPEGAERLFETIVPAAGRRRANTLAALAHCAVEQREPDRAASYCIDALRAARDVQHRLAETRVRSLRRRLQNWGDTPAVRELDEAIADA